MPAMLLALMALVGVGKNNNIIDYSIREMAYDCSVTILEKCSGFFLFLSYFSQRSTCTISKELFT